MKFSSEVLIVVTILSSCVRPTLQEDRHEVKRIGGYTIEFFKDNFDGTKNTVTSPYLIREILRTLYPFIRPDVQSQMRVALRIVDRDQDQLEYSKIAMSPHIKQGTSLYVQKRLPLNPALFQFIRVFQFVSANLLDKRLRRHKWPLDTASRRIQDSIAESRAKNLTALLLLNHMFVEANWQSKFPAHRLAPRYFNTFDGRRVKVDSMKTLDTFKYYCHYRMQYKLLEIPLVTSDDQQPLAMWVFLPIEGQTFGEMVKKLTFTNIFHASKRLAPMKVCVQLPKFSINYELDARDVLESLGMEDLFATRAFKITVGRQEALGDFVQISKIEVTETGLVNSNQRSSVGSNGAKNRPIDDGDPMEYFVCDQPFLFMIVANGNRPIMIGQYVGP